MAILETKDLRKIYGSGENEVHALDGVSISVEEGEFVAVIGTSGSGKSTLLNMIGGLDRPTSGSVTIRGKELLKMKDEELTIFRRRNIGFVFQNYNLLPVLNVYENIKLKEVDLHKARLEREIDNLPIDARFRERKIHDMTLRLDALYDTIVELEERIEDAKLRKSSIEMETITLDNIYKLMLNFGKLYDIISDEEKKSLITYLIKEIQIYPNGESEQPLKSIEFNFPIYRDGQEVRRLLWEKGNTVETVVLLTKVQK